MNHRRPPSSRLPGAAFTLIELLIVVAIIAILAAIAVPNFLEAQTRAKVSRALSDMRTVATALESYIVDSNRFPLSAVDAPVAPNYSPSQAIHTVYRQLTTPVAYITTFPIDAFKGDYRGDLNPNDPLKFRQLYDYRRTFPSQVGGRTTLNEIATGYNINAAVKPTSWLLYSPGPDREQNINTKRVAQGTEPAKGFGDPVGEWPYYDPTNGTVSYGDIVRAREGGSDVLAGL